jgi:NADPH:quinone reductase-like Zn-dependent oxidoreductase
MRAYIVPAGCKTSAELKIVDRPDPRPGPSQVLVRVHAASLNYRDQAIALGVYMGGPATRDTIPLSDGAGEVIEVGPGVTRFRPGDRVAALFNQIPPNGPSFAPRAALGSPLDGMLAELVVLYEDGVIALPPGLSFEQAACLPCAGVTAWHALMHAGRRVDPRIATRESGRRTRHRHVVQR